MSDKFLPYINRILTNEGGYTTDRHDAGNWTDGVVGGGTLKGTKFGISAASYPSLDIANLTKDQAIEIYRTDFWLKIHADRLPDGVAYAALDGAVNSGVARSIGWVQRAAGVLGDGVWGTETATAVGVASPVQLLIKYTALRLQFMTNASGWNNYGKGWVARIATNLMYAAGDLA